MHLIENKAIVMNGDKDHNDKYNDQIKYNDRNKDNETQHC